MSVKICFVLAVTVFSMVLTDSNDIPEYIKQCKKDDPQLVECFKSSLHHLRPYLAAGIPDIELPSVEPFKMDALALQLTGGPQGYKITLKNMEVFGASEFKVNSMKLSENGKPFEAQIYMPKLRIEAVYTSSGVLLIIPASGHGEFHAVFDGVTADLTGKISAHQKPEGKFLHVDSLNIKLNVKKVQLNISKAFNNNKILSKILVMTSLSS
ncbi:hypothetical protein ACFFRR_000054 [Megaselia abdita]